ncbi:MAG TPA: hypothetical protein VHV83_04880, partial [Armatimonadota bacterium]|nr:hypothetical protein [Armatimonadota bacterium]
DSWDSNQNLQMADGSRITVNMKYKLTGTKVVNGKTYLVIACDCSADIPSLTVNPQAPQGGAAAKPMTMGIKLNGTTSTLFDTAAGAYQETNMSMNVVITMAQQAGEDGEPMAMTMNMKMEGSMARTN